MSKSLWSRSVWNSLFNRVSGSRRLSRRRSSLRTNWKHGQPIEALEQRVVLAAVAVTVDSAAGMLSLVSTAGNTNEVVVVRAGATFTEVLVGGKLTTRIESLNSANLLTVNFNGAGSTGTGDSLSISGVAGTSLTVGLTDVERLQLNSATGTTVTSSTAADSPLTLVTSTITGALTLTHDGNIVQSGKLIVSGNTTLTAVSGSTDMNITLATSGNAFGVLALTGAAITINESSPTAISGTTASGALTVTSSGSITTSGALSVTGSGATSLTSNGSSINVSGVFSSSGNVSLRGVNVTFTDTAASSTLDLRTVTATSNLSVTAEGGAITHTSGNITVGSLASFTTGTSAATRADITLTAGSNNFGSFSATGRAISLTEKSSTDLATVNAVTNSSGGDLTITSSGAITDSGVVDVDGATSLTARNSAIALNSATNEFAGTIFFSGTNVALTDNDGATVLGASTSTAKGDLNLITTGTGAGVSQTGALIVSGRATVTATGKDINLGSANKFGSISVFGQDVTINETDATDLFDSSVTDDFVLTTTGAVTDSGNLNIDDMTSITAGAGKSITLDGTASTFDGQINLTSSTGAGTLVNTVASVLGNVTLKTFSLTSSAAVSQATSTEITVTGLLTVDATGSTIAIGTQTSTTDIFGSVSLRGTTVDIEEDNATNLAASVITGNFTLDSTTGGVSDSGDLAITGTTDIDAGSTNDITLDSSGSTFGETATTTDLVLNGNDISVLDNSDATKLGNVTATTGTLTVTANGAITDTGTITVTGGNLATFNAIGDDITLDSSNSQYTGAISLIGDDAVLSTGANAKATGDAAVDLGTSNVATLSVTTTNGNLTDSGAVKVGATTTLNTGTADITLNSSFNSFGELVLTSDAVTINERGDTDLGASTVTSLVVTSTGGIENNGTGVLNVSGATTLTANGGAISLTSDNTLNGTLNLVATTNISVRNTVATELGGVSTPLDFTLTTTTDAVTQTGNAFVGDLATITATGADITLNQSNAFGRLAFSGATVTIDETSADGTVLEASSATTALTITSAGNITDNGAVTAAGTTNLNAGTENITLDQTGNSFVMLELIGDVVEIFNSNATDGTDLGTSTIGTSLTLTSADGVTQTGNVSVVNALTISAGTAGAGNIVLGNANTLAVGSISVTATDVTITESSANGVILGQSVVNGNLVLATIGDVTDSGRLSVTGTTTITTTGDNIILDQTNAGGAPVSTFTGAIALSGSNITLASGAGLTLGNITATANLDISANGDVTNVLTIGTGTTDGTYGALVVTGTTSIDATLGANNHTIALDLANNGSTFGTTPVTTASVVDTTNPTLSITTASTTVASGNTITVTFTFDSAVTGFVFEDIVIGGTGTFTVTTAFSGMGTTYTVSGMVAPAGETVTFDVAANKAQETSSGIGNLVATRLTVSIESGLV